jgi:hypothetical protein
VRCRGVGDRLEVNERIISLCSGDWVLMSQQCPGRWIHGPILHDLREGCKHLTKSHFKAFSARIVRNDALPRGAISSPQVPSPARGAPRRTGPAVGLYWTSWADSLRSRSFTLVRAVRKRPVWSPTSDLPCGDVFVKPRLQNLTHIASG